MLLVRVKSDILAKLRRSVVRIKKRECSVASVTESAEAGLQYPPILDNSFNGRFRRNRDSIAEGIERARTVEEKMIKINMPRYYGFRCLMLNEFEIGYNAVNSMQYLTRTHVPDQLGLPSYYDNIVSPEVLKQKVEQLRGFVEECLVFEYSSRKHLDKLNKYDAKKPNVVSDIMSKVISKSVHRLLVSSLAPEYPHLMTSEVDYDPRLEAFWFAGGIDVPNCVRAQRRNTLKGRAKRIPKMPEDFETYPVDRQVQYIGTPTFQMRHSQPLPEFIPFSQAENPELTVPVDKFDPQMLGYWTQRRHGTNIPGFWPGDKNEFGFLSYHKSGYLAVRKFDDTPDAIRVQAVLGSWAWLLAQASNLGFSTLNEITYPLTNQMIITNGKWWTFSAYQLNTTIMHSFLHDENPRRNVCWLSKPMKLFEKIENGQVHGLNDEVLEHLVKFYINEPRERVGLQMKPFLQTGEGLVANVPGNTKRNWLEERFKHLQSNRPRHHRLPEVYNWQDIYLRKFKTMPIAKKREKWEFGVNMWNRRLDEHTPKYIPRAVRGSKHNPNTEKQFYPQ